MPRPPRATRPVRSAVAAGCVLVQVAPSGVPQFCDRRAWRPALLLNAGRQATADRRSLAACRRLDRVNARTADSVAASVRGKIGTTPAAFKLGADPLSIPRAEVCVLPAAGAGLNALVRDKAVVSQAKGVGSEAKNFAVGRRRNGLRVQSRRAQSHERLDGSVVLSTGEIRERRGDEFARSYSGAQMTIASCPAIVGASMTVHTRIHLSSKISSSPVRTWVWTSRSRRRIFAGSP